MGHGLVNLLVVLFPSNPQRPPKIRGSAPHTKAVKRPRLAARLVQGVTRKTNTGPLVEPMCVFRVQSIRLTLLSTEPHGLVNLLVVLFPPRVLLLRVLLLRVLLLRVLLLRVLLLRFLRVLRVLRVLR